MTKEELKSRIAQGESSTLQFKLQWSDNEKIKLGWAEMRNPLTAQLCAKTMPYRGLGSGITRALKSGERIDLVNDIERDKFVATVWRDVGIPSDRTGNQNISNKEESNRTGSSCDRTGNRTSNKSDRITDEKVYQLIKDDPYISKAKIAEILEMSESGIKKNITKLVEAGRIKRVGTFGGYYEILDK